MPKKSRAITRPELQAGSEDEGMEGLGEGGSTAPVTRKRGREGSTEPSSAGVVASTSAQGLAKKKNRTEEPNDDDDTPPTQLPNPNANEGPVGEVRRKVEKMTHDEEDTIMTTAGSTSNLASVDEGGDGDEDEDVELKDVDAASSGDDQEVEMNDGESVKQDNGGGISLQGDRKRKLGNRVTSTPDITEEVAKRIKEDENEEPPKSASTVDMDARAEDDTPADSSPVPPAASAPAPPPASTATPAKKPQATFGAFTASSSPFGSVSTPKAATSTSNRFGSSSTSFKSNLPPQLATMLQNANGYSSAFGGSSGAQSSSTSTSTPQASTQSKKPQATFGAFTSSASPFAAKSSTGNAFGSSSNLANTSASTSKPSGFGSPFGTAAAGGGGGGSAAAGWAASPWATPVKKAGTPTFGQNAGAAKEKSEGNEEEGEGEDGEDGEGSDMGKGQKSFGEILADESNKSPEKEKDDGKNNIMGEKIAANTGEENENTIHSARVKLHVMDSSSGWKERGTGALRLNVEKESKKARMVMRAEGVFRLILNVPIFATQRYEVADKYVRTTVFEEGKSTSLAIKTSSAATATALGEALRKLIKLEAGLPPTPTAPEIKDKDGEKVSDKVADEAEPKVVGEENV